MKRFFCMLCCLMAMAAYAVAEDFDLSSMSFEDLSALREQVDKEYFGRPEAEPISLDCGLYEVGVDFQPGRYNVICYTLSDSSYSNARIHVYETKDEYIHHRDCILDEIIPFKDESKSILLCEGNYIWVDQRPVTICLNRLSFEDATFDVPDGTFVPVYVYTVGEDLPAGNYVATAGSLRGGEFYIYESMEVFEQYSQYHMHYLSSYKISAKLTPKWIQMTLEDGQVLWVTEELVMKRDTTVKPVLVFD